MMLKYFPYSIALKHLDKIQITTDQKFGCAIPKLSKQIHKQFSSEECEFKFVCSPNTKISHKLF